MRKVWKLKNPVYASKTGKNAANETVDPTASNSVSDSLTLPGPPIGGAKRRSFWEPEVTLKIATVSFTKKS